MASVGDEGRPGTQKGTAVGLAQLTDVPSGYCPVMRDQCLVPVLVACQTQGEDKGPTGPVSGPELQEERLKLEEDRPKPVAEALEETGPRPMNSIMKPSHGLKRKAEGELPQGLPLQKEEMENSQSEPSPSAKQPKKAKKRKSLGTPVLPVVASTMSVPSETLGLEPPVLLRVLAGKAQRLRPLYQYINFCNPELNQAGEGDREDKVEVEPESELMLVPEEAGVEQLQALLPVAGELGPGFTLPCPNLFVYPAHPLVPLGEEAGEEPGGLPSLGVSGRLKAEVDKSTNVDINKMLSVCAAPLVPPMSPQYK
uniref:Chromosome 16 open reading frame 86 n=1 Tax=Catagonus wagneri TaxID=51154 RepID=A0A8C3YDG4_9CETA